MTGLSAFSKTMRMAWDQSVGDANLYSHEIKAIIDSRPEDDPLFVIEGSLCDFKNTREGLRQSKETAAELCEVRWNSSEPESSHLEKRIFNEDLGTTEPTSGGNTQINTGALISRILDTVDVPFLYSRIIRLPNRREMIEVRPGVFEPREEVDLEGKQLISY
jgi:hypothetical protein